MPTNFYFFIKNCRLLLRMCRRWFTVSWGRCLELWVALTWSKRGMSFDVWRSVAHSIWSLVCCVQPVGVDNTSRRKFDKEEYLERARQREQREKVVMCLICFIFYQDWTKLWSYLSLPLCIANFTLHFSVADPGWSPERQGYVVQLLVQ